MNSFFKHGQAHAFCMSRGAVALARVGGVVGSHELRLIRPKVIQSARGASCLVIRMDHSVNLFNKREIASSSTQPSAPCAVIVRDDEIEGWHHYAASANEAGLKKMVFLRSQLAMCRQWVDLVSNGWL